MNRSIQARPGSEGLFRATEEHEKAQKFGSSQYFGKRYAAYVTITWDVWGEQNFTLEKSLVPDDKGINDQMVF